MSDDSTGLASPVNTAVPIDAAVALREAFDTVEDAYEFMLAYAAQGRAAEAESEGGSQIRGYLQRFRSALDVVDQHIPALLPDDGTGNAFAEHFSRDTAVMKSIIDLLTRGPGITSDMIDNTNGLIAVRSFLTNLFFADQVLLPKRS